MAKSWSNPEAFKFYSYFLTVYLFITVWYCLLRFCKCETPALLKESLKIFFKTGLSFERSSKMVWRRQWQPTPVLLPGKSHGRRSLVGCSPWGRYKSDATERLHSHFSLFCIGEGNGNPLQCSCLENPRDGGASWADIYGVTQSQPRLKWLSSKWI